MNKTAIKNFAVWARNKLIADISYRAGLMGITESGIVSALPQSTGTTEFYDIGTTEPYVISGEEVRQRERLVALIKQKEQETDYKTAYDYVIEEVAYTWFNRLIAIRFMEINDYLPSHIRVLSSETGKSEPDLVTNPFDADLAFSDDEERKIVQLKQDNRADELFRMLFIKQCNELNEILPLLFEKTQDYSELLLNISAIDQDGVVYHLVHDIEERYFRILTDDDLQQVSCGEIEKDEFPIGQVEIIGWLYQYYNTEPKDETFALLKQNIKISKERVPAATQLFTPDWIVKYMVENSLGRLWISGHGSEELKSKWKYYLDAAEQNADIVEQLKIIRDENRTVNPEDIRIIDPCMGSGHILVRCFEVLMQIYEVNGYSKRDAVKSIIENNIYGLDIDKRASQMAYFAIMMKARQYDRRFFGKKITPHIYAFEESGYIDANGNKVEKFDSYFVDYFANGNNQLKKDVRTIIDEMVDAKEFGSIIDVSEVDFETMFSRFDEIENDINIYRENALNDFLPIVRVAKLMAQKYHVVVTNPPYMGSSGMGVKLAKYVKDNYPDTKADLFACFIDKGNRMVMKHGYNCMVTMQSWMSLSSFEKMRTRIVETKVITNLMHMENMVMGIAFGTAVTIFQNAKLPGYKGTFHHIKLQDIENDEPKEFPVKENRFSQIPTTNFSKIPGSPIAYWVSDTLLEAFANGKSLGEYALARNGMKTGDNGRFLRLWWEICNNDLRTDIHSYQEAEKVDTKWFPYNKGGEYRKWYGNNDYVVNWQNCGDEIFNHAKKDKRNVQDYPAELKFTPTLSWSLITSGKPAFRYKECNLSDIAGMSIYTEKEKVLRYLALLNSPISLEILKLIAPTINFQAGDIARIPILPPVNNDTRIIPLVEENIKLSRYDWDSFETSWDFTTHPLVKGSSIEKAFEDWENECNARFDRVKYNEETLNRILIEIYGLENELEVALENKDVTIRKANMQNDIKSLLSYAVGCMFGRYSLDELGICYAGGKWDDKKYSKFIPDADNIIPITDEEYLEDDIVVRLCDWLKAAYGENTLENNLDFIAKALGGKGGVSRDIIRQYFVNDFMKDHIKTYQKRPIYWLYESGKQNGYKALVYMHRYNADTIGNLRVDYLHRIQRVYESEINRMQDTIDHSSNTREVAVATKRKEKLQKQLKECRDYDEKISHLALSRIEIDLDDGVKVNYEKVQTASDGKKYQVLAKI